MLDQLDLQTVKAERNHWQQKSNKARSYNTAE